MTHKYPIGTWVCFYRSGILVIGAVQYTPEREVWDRFPQYHTTLGAVGENEILEARLP